MNDYELLNKALLIAKKAHAGQVDKAKEDYIFHPIMVALQCETIYQKVVALLHDVIEDCEDRVSYELLENEGFPSEVIEALKLVTHVKDESYSDYKEEYRAYIRKLKATGNEIAIAVKIADLTHNSDTRRLNGQKSPKYDEYIWAKQYLKENG